MKNVEMAAVETLDQYLAQVQEEISFSTRPSQKLGLALRRLLVSWVVEEKPRLVQSCSVEGIVFYGNYKIVCHNHEIRTLGPDGLMSHRGAGIKSFVDRLVHRATGALRSEMKARLDAWMAEQFKAKGIYRLDIQAQASAHVSWVVEGSLEPRWWGRKADVGMLTRYALKQAWALQMLNREVWGLAIRICGVNPSLELYNAIARQLPEVRARIAEAPNLAPLLVAPKGLYAEGPSEVLVVDNNAIARQRARLIEEGCTPQGWRWLTKQARQWVFDLTEMCEVSTLVPFLNTMARHKVGRLPVRFVRPSYVLSWFEPRRTWYGGTLSSEQRMDSMALFLKVATEAVRRRKAKAADVRDQTIEVLDFIKAGHPVNKGATWHSLLRRQEEWHRQQHRARIEEMKATREKLPAYQWTPIVSEVQYKDVTAVSLKTSDELWEEGDMLEHCVGTYAKKCFENEARIFSMRAADGQHLATLEIARNRNRWEIAQLRGYRNKAIRNPSVQALARQVLSQIKRVPMPSSTDNQVLRAGQASSWDGYHRVRNARVPHQVLQADLAAAEPEDLIPF